MVLGLFVLQLDNKNLLYSKLSKMENYGWGDIGAPTEVNTDSMLQNDVFGIDPFYIEKGDYLFNLNSAAF